MGNNMQYRRSPQYSQRQAVHERRVSSDKSCEELMNAIMEASFFAQDLKLYLDTHPDDTRAVEMYAEACRQYLACKAAFEDTFWPLTSCSAGRNGKWDWPEGVWPPRN